MPQTRRKNATNEIAERLLHLLESQRGLGSEAYPLTLAGLLELATAAGPPELLAKSVRGKPFKERVALVKLDKSVSLVALADDRRLLAGDARVLVSALQAATPKNPTAQPIAKIAAKVPADLRACFEESVQNRVRENALPSRIGVLEVQGAVRLYLRDRPPEDVAAAELCLRLVQTLQALRSQNQYPTTLGRLLERAGPDVPSPVLKKALVSPPFQRAIVRALPRDPDTPLALAEDAGRLADSPLLLEFLLNKVSKPAVKAFALKDLKKALLECLRQPFVAAVSWRMEQGKLPASLGWVWIKTPHLFFTRDLQGGPVAAAPVAEAKPAPDGAAAFAGQFAAAFERLDREVGGRNFVSLVDLRRALSVPRGIFDAELHRLRQAGRFSLSAAEGRHGITPEEREAGLPEEGSLLLFVSRIGP